MDFHNLSKISKVNIFLGNSSNINCDYSFLKTTNDIIPENLEEVKTFTESLCGKLENPSLLVLWAGETLLYFKSIKTICEIFCNRFPNCKVKINTNAYLLTDEMVRWFNSHKNIFLSISILDWKLFDDEILVKRILSLNRKSFTKTLTDKNIEDIKNDEKKYFEIIQKYGLRKLKLEHIFLKETEHCHREFHYTKESVDKFIDICENWLIPEFIKKNPYAKNEILSFLRVRDHEVENLDKSRCSNDTYLSVDLKGNRYSCYHTFDQKYIFDNIFSNRINIANIIEDSEECKNCECFKFCRGGCTISKNRKVDCYFQKRMAGLYEKFDKININRLFFVLGGACNYHCRHCIQHDHTVNCIKEINPKVFEFLNSFYKGTTKIQFFGGEPLLYWENLKKVVLTCGDRFEYSITTNGSLLTQEIVNFCNEHGIEVVVSNDGIDTDKIRDENVLENEKILNLIKQIRKRSIDGIIHAYNQDILKFITYAKDKCGDNTNVFMEHLICGKEMPTDIVDYNFDFIKDSYQFIKEKRIPIKILEDTRIEIENVDKMESKNIQEFSYKLPKCKSGINVFSVDTEGNIFMCKNYNTSKIGTVDIPLHEMKLNTIKLFRKLVRENMKKKGCFECEIFKYCKGNCPFEPPSEQQRKNCELLKIKYHIYK